MKKEKKKGRFNGVVYITYIRTFLAVEFGNTFIGSSGVATELNHIPKQLAMRVYQGRFKLCMSPIYLRNRSEAWGHTCCAQALARGGDEVPSRDHDERESLDQLDREEIGIEDEVKLRERGGGREIERERERGRRRKGGRKKERISPSSTFRPRRPIRPGRIPHWARVQLIR